MDLEWIKRELVKVRGDLDVRTDQCEIVRVHCGSIMIGIRYEEDQKQYVTRASVFQDDDFWEDEIWSACAPTEEGIVREVLAFLDQERGPV